MGLDHRRPLDEPHRECDLPAGGLFASRELHHHRHCLLGHLGQRFLNDSQRWIDATRLFSTRAAVPGDTFAVVASGFNDWRKPDAVALLCFENEGQQRFTARVLAHAPTHLVVVKAADMNNDGRPELVTGSFCFYPPFERSGRITLWERRP